MRFISENVSTYDALFFILTTPLVFAPTVMVILFTFIITGANALYTEDGEEKPPTAWIKPILFTCLNGAVTVAIAALLTYAASDVTRGHYEASGTIDTVTFNKTHAGHPDGVHDIKLILDNGDPVTIQIPLSDPDTVVPGADFTLKSDLLMKIVPYDEFRPIENLRYSERYQSFIDRPTVTDPVAIDFIVAGKIVKGD